MSVERGTSEVCPVGFASGVLGDRWSLLILRNALLGQTRFDQLRASLGIADNILSNRLSRLVQAGLLVKEDYRHGARTRQHYRLTAAGADLQPVLEALARWGHAHADPSHPTQALQVVHDGCGGAVEPGGTCSACGALATGRTSWLMPWLSPDPIPVAQPLAAG